MHLQPFFIVNRSIKTHKSFIKQYNTYWFCIVKNIAQQNFLTFVIPDDI